MFSEKKDWEDSGTEEDLFVKKNDIKKAKDDSDSEGI